MGLTEVRSLLAEACKISQSQAGQDLFVLAMTGFKRHGRYLEIGCGHPKDNSNTWLLEKFFDWNGFSVDIQNAYHHRYHAVKQNHWPQQPTAFNDLPVSIQQEIISTNSGLTQDLYRTSDWCHRPNTHYIESDALAVDYKTMDVFFDYLQIDLDSPMQHFQILQDLTTYKKFRVITFEHDAFTGTEESLACQQQSRSLLSQLGYKMIANNVTIQPDRGYNNGQGPMFFEDWWVDPALIAPGIFEEFVNVDDGTRPKYYTDILFRS